MIINPVALQRGSILFIRSHEVISSAIRRVLHCQYSHVAIYMGDGKVIEADWKGVIRNPYSRYVNNPDYTVEILNPGLTDEQMDIFLRFVTSKIGDGYDYSLFLGNFLSRIFHRSRRVMGLWNVENNWICTELVSSGMEEAGILFIFPTSQVTPEDLEIKLRRMGIGS